MNQGVVTDGLLLCKISGGTQYYDDSVIFELHGAT